MPSVDAPVAPPGGSDLRISSRAQTALLLLHTHRIVWGNAAAAALLGRTEDALAGLPLRALLEDGCADQAEALVEAATAEAPSAPCRLRCVDPGGTPVPVQAIARRLADGAEAGVLVTLHDARLLVDALRARNWSMGMLAQTEALCRTGSFELSLPGGELRLSAGLCALLGRSPEQSRVSGIDALDWVPEDERAFVDGIWKNATPNEAFEFQHRIDTRDGRQLVVLHRGILTTDAMRGIRGVAILQDITAQREAEQRIQDLASHDAVSGLHNRAWLLDRIDGEIHATRWSGRSFALLVIEVPRIPEIRTRMGFAASDRIARSVAARLREATTERDAVARLGDAEFGVLLETASASAVDETMRRAIALRDGLLAPIRLEDAEVLPDCRIGIALFPHHGETPSVLLEHAQAALPATAATGLRGAPVDGGIACFTADAAAVAARELRMETALHRALADDGFTLELLPQVRLADGTIHGARALLRWRSEDLGPVPPAEFEPVARRAGLLEPMQDWTLRAACRLAAGWRHADLKHLRVCVALAPAHLQRADLLHHLDATLRATGADPANVALEFSEGMLLGDLERAVTILRGAKALGFEIHMDDFGARMSSLNGLSRLPIDVLRLDPSFVHDAEAPTRLVSLTRAVIQMAHGLQMQVLAQGIARESALGTLAAQGCDRIEGEWFSGPVGPEAFEALVRSGRRLPERFITRARTSRTLLLVDDEENILSALKRLLRRSGYHILTARSAHEGLERLAQSEVDVIVSDQRMPGMTGVEFLRRAKSLYPHTVRIVLSGYTELQSIIDAVNEGAIYRFLTKPWDDELLRAHIAEAFRQKELADENLRLARQVELANTDLAGLNERLARLLDQKREQAELLAATAAGTRAVLDELPAAVLGVDPDGMIAYANRAAERALDEVEGLTGAMLDAVLPGGPGAAETACTTDRSGRPWRLVRGALSPDGHDRGKLYVLLPDPRPLERPLAP